MRRSAAAVVLALAGLVGTPLVACSSGHEAPRRHPATDQALPVLLAMEPDLGTAMNLGRARRCALNDQPKRPRERQKSVTMLNLFVRVVEG